MITLRDIKANDNFCALIKWAGKCMETKGYTEHGIRHCSYVSTTARNILSSLDYPERVRELAAIAGYIHDIGNSVNRKNHGPTGACLAFPLLMEMGMDIDEICMITSAVGNHEEETGSAVNEVSAAIIIADKSDAHRTRVGRGKYNPEDIHDRVNYAIRQSKVMVDSDSRIIQFSIEMDKTSSVMEFMQIYMTRMIMCENAAKYLGCEFQLVANGQPINNQSVISGGRVDEESA
ncbi:MAG: HD domain-containing protein [Clostridia bacterium]|jgi:metal-dependent HD superfamily phosphatase/phosphodiesterase|nr:HD domain-containing protein [Clostridiales bacterium]